MDNLIEKQFSNCELTGLPTHLKHRGHWISHHFIKGGDEIYKKYKDSHPEMTIEDAVDIFISAMSYRAINGEEKMDIEHLKHKGTLWNKIKNKLNL